jgi:protein phosphatase
MPLVVTHAALSDRGRTHDNDDRWFADAGLGLYLVADGMADDRPSQMVVDRLPGALRSRLGSTADLSAPEAAEAVRLALGDISEQVRNRRWIGGSTVVLALVRDGRVLIAHLGDSRAYLVRDKQLERLTRDHSDVQESVDRGKLTPEEARRARGCPTQFVGMWGDPEPDIRLLELQEGDRILLCSDGLPEMLSDDDLLAILNKWKNPTEACVRLIAAANAAGGRDNLTALLVDVAAGSP